MNQEPHHDTAADDHALNLGHPHVDARRHDLLLNRLGADDETLDRFRGLLAARSMLNQALGILMHLHMVSADEAQAILRHTSQTTNRPISIIAAEIVENMTGHTPDSLAP